MMRTILLIVILIPSYFCQAQLTELSKQNSFYMGSRTTLTLGTVIHGSLEATRTSEELKERGFYMIFYPRIDLMYAMSNNWSIKVLTDYQRNSRSSLSSIYYSQDNRGWTGETGTPLYQVYSAGFRFNNHFEKYGNLAPVSSYFSFGLTSRNVFASHDNVRLANNKTGEGPLSLGEFDINYHYLTADLGFTMRSMLSLRTYLDLSVETGLPIVDLVNPYKDEVNGVGRLNLSLWNATKDRFKLFDVAKFHVGVGVVLGKKK